MYDDRLTIWFSGGMFGGGFEDEFRVTFWNLNYVASETDYVTGQVAQNMEEILLFCVSSKSRQEIMDHLGLSLVPYLILSFFLFVFW